MDTARRNTGGSWPNTVGAAALALVLLLFLAVSLDLLAYLQ